MATVGSIIVAARELMPDIPAALRVPSTPSLVASTSGSLATATYYAKVTAINAFGETSADDAASVSVAGPIGNFTFIADTIPGATAYRCYYGDSEDTVDQYIEQTSTSFNITSLTAGTAGTPPPQNTAWLPDSDGQFVGAAAVYRWLNDGLKLAAKLTGGIADMTGLCTNSSAPIYALTGQWLSITNGWYQGYQMALIGKGDAFQANRVTTNVAGGFVQSKQGNVNYIEFWPIPASNGSSTTTSGSISASVTTIPLTSTSGFLDHGLAKIENEIVYYGAISGSSLVQCIRGLGGTTAAAHTSGVTATELNARFDGFRMPNTYAVGDSAVTIDVPPAWETLLVDYLLSRFREAEQDKGEAQRLRQQVEKEFALLAKSNKPLAGPRQMGGSPTGGLDVYFPRLGGGILLP